MSRLVALSLGLCAVTGCFFNSDDPNPDIVGPYTGARTRFVVDSMLLPMNNNDTRVYASDLDGDRTPDNQLGQVMSTLSLQGISDQHLADRIAGGEIYMVVEIQADDLQNDDRAGVWVYGFEGAEARPIGGEIVGGTFIPNFVRDTSPDHTGAATIALPVMADADASRMEMPHMEISLVPDGNGGYDAQIHGGVRDAYATARVAIEQQLAQQPEQHRWMWMILDTDRDGVVEELEWMDNPLLETLLSDDITLDGEKVLSVGFGFHLRACPSGNCAVSTPDDHCFDRVLDGDEVDVDCGGSCARCGSGLACEQGTDCQSGTCDGNNVCTSPTCFDGVKNGYEASTDCGGACALKCELGAVCGMSLDCASGKCSASFSGGTGVCVQP